MPTKQTIYKYKVYLSYINNNVVTKIDNSSLQLMIIDYNYEASFAPVVYITIKLDVALYNDMQANNKSGKMLLEVYKYDSGETNVAEVKYIKKQLSYFFSTNSVDTETVNTDNSNNSTAYKVAYIGLVDNAVINRDKQVINTIFKNTNLETMVYKYLNFPIVKESFDYNPIYDLFIVPPLENISSFLRYMNDRASFYTTGYRYFNDFEKAYLLSNKSKNIDIGDGKYSTIKITVTSQTTDSDNSNLDGMMEDTTQKLYILQVNSKNFNINKNITMDNIYNQFYAIDSSGKTRTLDLDINVSEDSKSKPKLIRVYNDNLDYIKTIGNDIEMTSTVINISKSNIDNSILEPYKQFNITLPTAYKDSNGRYILSAKKETYAKEGNSFVCATLSTYKKVMS